MYKRIANHISESLVSSKAITETEITVYSYAAELLLSSITGLVICFGIGILFDAPLGSVIFLAVYCPLRQFSGGYHAANHIYCGAIFCFVFLINMIVARTIPLTANFMPLMILITSGLSVITIIILGPIEDKNRPLNDDEIARFRKKSVVLSIIALVAIASLVKFQQLEISYYACSAVLILSILLVMGKIKNMKGEKMKQMIAKSTSLMAVLLLTLATASVNSASWWMIYQPEVPKELLKQK
jgi:accessory gene regulator B